MAHPAPSRHCNDYSEAAKLFQDGRLSECNEIAKLNLTDGTLPPYYRIRNLLLIAFSTHGWHGAERCRKEIRAWCDDVVIGDETEAMKMLLGEINRLDDLQRTSVPKDVDPMFLRRTWTGPEHGTEDVEEEDGYLEDPEEVRLAEEEVFGPDINVIALLHEALAAEEGKKESLVEQGGMAQDAIDIV